MNDPVKIKTKLLEVLHLVNPVEVEALVPSQRKVWETMIYKNIWSALDYTQDILDGEHSVRYWPEGVKVILGESSNANRSN